MSMKTFAFKNRLFLVYAAVIAFVVVLFSIVLFTTTTSMNRQTELYHQKEIYKNNLEQIENILRQMDRIASQVVANNEILGSFIPLAAEGISGEISGFTQAEGNNRNYFDENLIDGIRISSLLSGINGIDKYASRISVYNGNGDYVSTGTLYETPEAIRETLSGPHYETMKARVLQGGSLVVDIHKDTWSTNPGLELVSLYRALSSYTSAVYGLVEIQVGTGAFEEYTFWQNEEDAYYLVNGAGTVIYPPEGAENAQALSVALDEGQDDVVLLETRMGQRDVVLMCSRVLPADWMFVRVLPEQALLAPYTNNTVVIACVCLVLLCCLLVVTYYLANRIARPLQSLSERFAGVNLQNMQQSTRDMDVSYSIAELDALNRAFHSMLARLDKSISMEIQAHMRALQSQMNPHFLFNMLSVIIESSEEQNDTRTVAMCMKLSAMLRYIADFNGDNASLAEELQHTRNYLDLMKDRYETQFEYEIITEGDVDSVIVPKMIIQPLAENCFSHGFQNTKPPWHIRIEVKEEKDRWNLRVMDNGSGITDETVQAIRQKTETYRSDMATNYKNLRLGGMGLVNTLLRLSFAQNGLIDFSIGNGEERGTIIEIGGSIYDPRAHR